MDFILAKLVIIPHVIDSLLEHPLLSIHV